MTKEQEEAIEYLEESVLIYKNTIPKISKSIETVLSMLKEKDAEIEKKDKIIDLMAEQIKSPELTMKIESFDIKPKTKFGTRYLNKEEVKQYFERKATKMSQKGRKNVKNINQKRTGRN